jgi:hypothetical protein
MFGDQQEKIKRYNDFWSGAEVDRPLIGFSLGGWFPLHSYTALHKFRGKGRLFPDQVQPEEFLPDYDRLVAQWESVEDDVIRGVAPIPPFPWLESMLGSPVHVGEESLWAEEGGFDYANTLKLDWSAENPWRCKYLEFVAALKDHFGDRVPVGQPILRGVSDMIAALRKTSQMIFDLYDFPEAYKNLGKLCTDLLIGLVSAQQRLTGPFAGGYFLEQFSLWAPDRVIRLQEDASALFSPALYEKLLKEEDRRQAAAFPYSLIHLHSSSLFILDRILNVDPILCFQINKDAAAAIPEEIPYFKMVQGKGKRLLIRGKLTPEDLALLRKSLSARGLYLQIVVDTPAEIHSLQEFFMPWS